MADTDHASGKDNRIRLVRIDGELSRCLEQSSAEFAERYGASLGACETVVREVVSQTRAHHLQSPRAPEWGGFLTVDSERSLVIGTCGFVHGPDEHGAVEIAYFTFPEFEGQGYATAMAAELVRRAGQAADAIRGVVAHTLPETNASTRILGKVGFQRDGEVQDDEVGTAWRWRLLTQ